MTRAGDVMDGEYGTAVRLANVTWGLIRGGTFRDLSKGADSGVIQWRSM